MRSFPDQDRTRVSALAGGFSTPDHQGSPTTFFFTHCASVTLVPFMFLDNPMPESLRLLFLLYEIPSPSLPLPLSGTFFSTFMSQLKFPLCARERFPPPLTLYLKLLFYYLFISLENVLHCVAIMVICLFAYHSLPASKRAEITLVTLWLCALCLEQCPRHGNSLNRYY